MHRCALTTALAASVFCLAACWAPPPSFRLVEIGAARELLRTRHASLVEAYEEQSPTLPAFRGVRWLLPPGRAPEPPELPDGPVLVVASKQTTGYRAAAALARERNREVYVLITASAEERGTLYALDPQQQEEHRGRDS